MDLLTNILTLAQKIPTWIHAALITGGFAWITRGQLDLRKETRDLIKCYIDDIEQSWEDLSNEVIAHQNNTYSGSASDHQSFIEKKKKITYNRVARLSKTLRKSKGEEVEANYYRILDGLTSNLNQRKAGSGDNYAISLAEKAKDEFLALINDMKLSNSKGRLKVK